MVTTVLAIFAGGDTGAGSIGAIPQW